jgi:hypothetical protein
VISLLQNEQQNPLNLQTLKNLIGGVATGIHRIPIFSFHFSFPFLFLVFGCTGLLVMIAGGELIRGCRASCA